MKSKKIFLAVLLPLVIVSLSAAASIGEAEKQIRKNILETANNCLGSAYRYNGSTPAGFDDEGLVQYIYYKNGICIPKEVKQQFVSGEVVSSKDVKPGDLLFFYSSPIEKLQIEHVGVYMGKATFLHISGEGGRVCLEKIARSNYWGKAFAGARSYRTLFTVSEKEYKELQKSKEKSNNNVTKKKSPKSNTSFESEDM